MLVVAVLLIGFVWVWRHRRSVRRTVTGTARVLSLAKSADFDGLCWFRIELEVNIPGREPKVVLTEQKLGAVEQAAAQPGETVPVRVYPDDVAKDIRIDFNQADAHTIRI